MARKAQMPVRDLRHAAVLARLSLGLQLRDQKPNVLRSGRACSIRSRGALLAITLPLLALQLFEAAVVVSFSSFADGGAALVPLGLLLAPGLADGEEGLHFGLALLFQLAFRFRELDDGVDAAALAFTRDDLFRWAGFWVVRGEGDDATDGVAVVDVGGVGAG